MKKLYEAMFLVDSAQAAADWDGIMATIKKVLERADAEILSIRKWDERRLAYEIKGKTRGTYMLCYFRADGQRIQGIEQDVRLSELLMRVLILSAEHMTAQDVEKDTPATRVEKEKQRAVQAAAVKDEAAQRAKARQEKPEGDDEGGRAEEPSEAEIGDQEETAQAWEAEESTEAAAAHISELEPVKGDESQSAGDRQEQEEAEEEKASP